MQTVTQYLDPMQLELPEDRKRWYVTEKRTLLQFPVPRDIARVRLLNELRAEIRDNSGWIWPRVKYSGDMVGDILTVEYSYTSRQNPTVYYLTGRLLDMEGGSQIVLRVTDDFVWRLLLTPFLALMVTLSGVVSLGLQGSVFFVTLIAVWSVLVAIGLTAIYAFSTWQRNVALKDVSRFISRTVVQDTNTSVACSAF